METPRVKTRFRITEKLVFDIYAYKKLTQKECAFAIQTWMRSKKRKSLPKTGHFKIITIAGFDEE